MDALDSFCQLAVPASSLAPPRPFRRSVHWVRLTCVDTKARLEVRRFEEVVLAGKRVANLLRGRTKT